MLTELLKKNPLSFSVLSESETQLLLDNQDTAQVWQIVRLILDRPETETEHAVWINTLHCYISTLKQQPEEGLSEAEQTQLENKAVGSLATPDIRQVQTISAVISEAVEAALAAEYADESPTEEIDVIAIEKAFHNLTWFDIFGDMFPSDPQEQKAFLAPYKHTLDIIIKEYPILKLVEEDENYLLLLKNIYEDHTTEQIKGYFSRMPAQFAVENIARLLNLINFYADKRRKISFDSYRSMARRILMEKKLLNHRLIDVINSLVI